MLHPVYEICCAINRIDDKAHPLLCLLGILHLPDSNITINLEGVTAKSQDDSTYPDMPETILDDDAIEQIKEEGLSAIEHKDRKRHRRGVIRGTKVDDPDGET